MLGVFLVCLYVCLRQRASITFHGDPKRGPVALCLSPFPHKTWQTDLPLSECETLYPIPPSPLGLSILKGQEITV